MLKSEDRRRIAELNGMSSSYANYRDASADTLKWKKPPTVIPAPSNSTRSGMGHPSGSNPFSMSLGGRKSYGNPTSTRTLINASTQNEGPPKKKAKIDHTFTSNSSKQPRSTRSGKEALRAISKGAIESQEIIVVNDEEVEIDSKPTHHPENSQSSDELNLIHHPNDEPPPNHPPNDHVSRYSFSKTNNLVRDEAMDTGLVPDGKNTQWVDKTYGTVDEGGPDESDPIESFDYQQGPETRGNVKRITQMIESRLAPKKIDLKTMKSTGKAKQMKPKFNPNVSNSSTTLNNSARKEIPMKRKIDDAIATANTPQRTDEQGPITLKEVFIEQRLYSSSNGQKLQAFFSRDRLLYIKADGVEKSELEPWAKEFETMEYTVESSPVIQLKSNTTNFPRLFTMHIDPRNQKERNLYDSLFEKLKKTFSPSLVRDNKALLNIARMHMIAGDGNVTSTRITQSNHPKEKPQKSPEIVNHPRPLRYTPENYTPENDVNSEGNSTQHTSTSRFNVPSRVVPPRRSTRNAPPEKPVDQDKVILVYPQGLPGAVNITNGDLARLQPGEYLNDTLIEFGLKLWLRELEAKQPELASQVHLFNSFFYKKLNNKKNDATAFETVRKWTSKFDIFQKKYIIVPINEHMHWYLAIIYEPEHILSTTVPDDPSPRKRTRLSAKLDVNEGRSSTTTESPPKGVEDATNNSTISVTSSEAEVERNLDAEFQSSCTIDVVSIDNTDKIGAEKVEDDAHSDLSYVSEPRNPMPFSEHRRSLGGSEELSRSVSRDDPLFSDGMDVDISEDIQEPNKHGITSVESTESATAPTLDVQEEPPLGAISTASFYQSAKSKGKQKAKSRHISIDVDEGPVMVPEEPIRKTYIFTFDSLGTNHPHAVKKLGQYLRMEAKDKKGISNAGLAAGKTVFVPVQPNFCDCGVYLLHFAKTFLSDPAKYYRLITSQPRSVSNEERQELWHDKKVADLRTELAMQIQQLSIDWQKERASKEKEQLQGGSDTKINSVDSDSEIEIPSPKKKSGRAVRIRG